jgi:hypothetical protein
MDIDRMFIVNDGEILNLYIIWLFRESSYQRRFLVYFREDEGGGGGGCSCCGLCGVEVEVVVDDVGFGVRGQLVW